MEPGTEHDIRKGQYKDLCLLFAHNATLPPTDPAAKTGTDDYQAACIDAAKKATSLMEPGTARDIREAQYLDTCLQTETQKCCARVLEQNGPPPPPRACFGWIESGISCDV
jgi:hypothetical protein